MTTPIKNDLIYILHFEPAQQQAIPLLSVTPYCAHLLRNGSYSKLRPIKLQAIDNNEVELRPIDQTILEWLSFAQLHSDARSENHFLLQGSNGTKLLQQLLETQRCYWANTQQRALKLGSPRQASLEWVPAPGGLQQLRCRISGSHCTVLALTPPWYIDHDNQQVGSLITGLDSAVISSLLALPPLRPEQIKQVQAVLHKRLTNQTAKPTVIPTLQRKQRVKPAPLLRLTTIKILLKLPAQPNETMEITLPVAVLSFRYGEAQVNYGNPERQINYVYQDQLIQIARQIAQENAAFNELLTLGLKPLHYPLAQAEAMTAHYLEIAAPEDEQGFIKFSLEQIPELRTRGWQIQMDSRYPYHVVNDQNLEWYSNIELRADQHWFDLELGINVAGERINLLPLLVQLIQQQPQQLTPTALAQLSNDAKLLARLPDGRFLPVPVQRVRHILEVLTELYDTQALSKSNKLRLSKLRIAQLLELENAVADAAKWRWLGGEKLRRLGQQLKNFRHIEPAIIPAGFQTQLRAYQQEGLDWLQFLRQYDLAGVLADDMGLGKTVQTLAHLWIEKQSGRMQKPCLVIAPTSLMTNWLMEAARFTPDLSILVLQGANRKINFKVAKNYDVIVTTYPLLVRDQTFLTAQEYHLLILDEAHIIKNPRAKATQIVQLLQAKHRLCLTGTPLENNLGELWSLFNFLLPGLLGDAKQFQRLFRIPIEKYQDEGRQIALAKRIAPFLLRRTKQEVMQELPAKIEMIRPIELEEAQRDLYESIRLAMHERVAMAVQNKGLEQSQIIVLDALLKLRQICCDPRLLKLPSAQKITAPSAKLNALLEMLPSLVAEGRRILLFSQFTSMLALIEEEVIKLSIAYVKLTGQTIDRATPIARFQAGEIPLFLISLKAGGVGLNLTAADTVIHYDPWWNPAVEHQATDRAHRIGQDKTVFVYKLIAAGSVEERIVAMQARKQNLLSSLFIENSTNKSGLEAADLDFLFQPLHSITS